ncbi:MAG: hypothetical protein ACRCV9_03495 [Burkholderiaceae bacterium]
MPTPPAPPDLIGLLVLLFAGVVSAEIAHATAAYIAVAMLAMAGAILALTGSERSYSTAGAIGFVLVRVLLACVITVSLAGIIEKITPDFQPRQTMIFIAFFIGWTPDLNKIRDWAAGLFARFAERKADGK